jgi:hypothetical protein
MTSRAWLVTFAAAFLACGGTTEPPGPEAGVVVAALNTPNDRDGALIVRIVGIQTELKAAGSYRMATTAGTQVTTVKAILTGQIVDGDILEFTIPDVSKLATYVVVIEQAAARDTYALLDPSGYNITLRVK